MDFDTTWDIEKYRSPFECEEHWELRKHFLMAHKDKYPEEQLVCLAQVFFNVELLGCKYPEKTMQLVITLSEGIADSFREKKHQKIQRTFIKASDAAGAKIKGQSFIASTSTLNNSVNTLTSLSVNTEQNIRDISSNNVNDDQSATFWLDDISNFNDEQNDDVKHKVFSTFINQANIASLNHLFNDLVITKMANEDIFVNGMSILNRSLTKKSINPQCKLVNKGTDTISKWKCDLIIEDKVMSCAETSHKQFAKKTAVHLFIDTLQNTCYTLEEKVKYLSDGSTVGKNYNQAEEKPVCEHNIGNKMMKMMGWKGGGLGKTEQGIEEPVTVRDHVRRSGLGTNLTQDEVMKKINNKLKTYSQTATNYDLVFSSDFSKEERAKLHILAHRYHLKTRSFGTGNDRHLVVSNKKQDCQSLIQTLIDCGGENDRYILIHPRNM